LLSRLLWMTLPNWCAFSPLACPLEFCTRRGILTGWASVEFTCFSTFGSPPDKTTSWLQPVAVPPQCLGLKPLALRRREGNPSKFLSTTLLEARIPHYIISWRGKIA
jgi:hypothetical protein